LTAETAKKWIKQALHDLSMAEKNIEIEGYDVAAFLAHQAVEKLLKAQFVLKKEKIPKLHYIDELARMLGLSEEVIEPILSLTADYTLTRYPDVSDEVPYEQYDETISREKVAAARKVFQSLKDSYISLIESDNHA